MGRRGSGRRTVQSEQARDMLRVESGYPPIVKAQLRMLAAGGRLPAQRCLICGTRKGTVHLEVWLPAGALSPVPGDEAKLQTYWTCRKHHEQPAAAEEIGRLLARRTVQQ